VEKKRKEKVCPMKTLQFDGLNHAALSSRSTKTADEKLLTAGERNGRTDGKGEESEEEGGGRPPVESSSITRSKIGMQGMAEPKE